MLIRTFRPEDGEAVVALWERCDLTRPWNDPAMDIERKLAVQPDLFFVGTVEGAIAATAMAGYDGHRGNVYYLAVDPDEQGRGYGRQIMARVEEALGALGCPKVNVMIRSANLAVAGFYQALGYQASDVVLYGRRLIADA
jgi:ribosomal protein S18 acetylase RimI-like enzyme